MCAINAVFPLIMFLSWFPEDIHDAGQRQRHGLRTLLVGLAESVDFSKNRLRKIGTDAGAVFFDDLSDLPGQDLKTKRFI